MIWYLGEDHRLFCFFFSSTSALKLFLSCTEHIVDTNFPTVYIKKKGACNC